LRGLVAPTLHVDDDVRARRRAWSRRRRRCVDVSGAVVDTVLVRETIRSPFIFVLCQSGAEKAVRAELVTLGFSPAFGAEGFVSAKAKRPLSVDELPSVVLGRRVCLSVGKAGSGDGVVDVEALVASTQAVLHHERGERGPSVAGQADRAVVTVVTREGGAFVGLHVHRAGLSPDPVGDPALVVPTTAPSRAWLKLEEAMRLVPVPLDEHDVVVEVGCAPGGQTRALLDRGCRVFGVDPNAMDPRILQESRFTHLHCSARHVQWSLLENALPGPVTAVVVDVNQRPQAALASVAELITRSRRTLCCAVFTLKLGEWSMLAELPRWRRRIEDLCGPQTTTTAFQLPSNRQELTVVALTPRGAARIKQAPGRTRAS
jgi:23S rRNA (cytidine2498-2'-O)-methyltransferase